MIRRVVTDESIPFEERNLLLSNYLPSLYTREKLEIDRKKSKVELEFPKTKEDLIQFVKNKNILVSDINNFENLLVAVKSWIEINGLM